MTLAVVQLCAMAAKVLALPAQPRRSVLGLAHQCRQAGVLNEAASLFAYAEHQSPPDRQCTIAGALRNLGAKSLALTPAPDDGADVSISPIVRIDDALPEAVGREILELARCDASKFRSSEVATRHVYGLDENVRASSVLDESASFRRLSLPHLTSALIEHDVASLLSVPQPAADAIELQTTLHTDGDFFSPHTDTSDALFAERLITFVYYFHVEPKAFSGGDLLVYDHSKATGDFTKSFTRIIPANNTLVFFRANTLHEVTPVSLPSHEPGDGRFTINGWFRA